MCSDPSDPIAALTQAIEALEADSVGPSAAADLAERVARVWALVIDLDPELARRAARYRPGHDRD
jgi:hypothetical protein